MRLALLYILLSLAFEVQGQVVLNEVVSANKTILKDNYGETPDIIELYNYSQQPVNLEGWQLTEDQYEDEPWLIPSVNIPSGGFLLIYASGRGTSDRGEVHSDFRISKVNTSLYLSDPSGTSIDSIFIDCNPEDNSFGRFPDGSSNLVHFTVPTPGTVNSSSRFTISISKDSLEIINSPGYVSIRNFNPSSSIFYTVDGSEPTEASIRYTSGIDLTSFNTSKDIAYERTSSGWTEPDSSIPTLKVIRAVAIQQGCPVSDISSISVLSEDNSHALPVISILTDRSGFFSKSDGIYVPGTFPGQENYLQHGSFWARDVDVHVFKNSRQVLNVSSKARIHGRGTRVHSQKSLRFYAGEKEFNNVFFQERNYDSLKRFILRSPSTDIGGSMIRDELAASLIGATEIDYRASSSAIVYINGVYWGIHHVKERQDRYYFRDNFNVHEDSVDVLGFSLDGDELIEGSDEEYKSLLQFIRSNDLSIEENYLYVLSQMDIINYIDYNIAQLYFANADWPDHNVRYWKAAGGKWRWIFFDCDYCFANSDRNHIGTYLRSSTEYDEGNTIMRKLLENPRFRNQFRDRFYELLNTVFDPAQVTSRIDSIHGALAPEVPLHISRWHNPDSYYSWNQNVDELKAFAIKRNAEMLAQVKEYFGSPFQLYPNPANRNLNITTSISSDPFHLELYDITGNKVISALAAGAGTIDISSLSDGIYIAKIIYLNQVFNHKIVVVN